MNEALARLLPISPGGHRPTRDLLTAAAGLRRAGVRQLLLREPRRSAPALEALARELAPGLRLIIHARCAGGEALAAAGGFGLHLPGEADVAAVRGRFSGPLGYSAHSLEALLRAREAGADYALISPIWSPGSKPGDRRPTLGVQRAARIQRAAGIPVFALGGLTPARARRCRAAGIYGVAGVGAFFGAQPEESEGAARAFLTALADAQRQISAPDSSPQRSSEAP